MPKRVYVASANGGVWYSSDTGQNWQPLGSAGLDPTANWSDLSLTIGSLFVEFGKNGALDAPDKDIVYVGTGEARPRPKSYPSGMQGRIGILRLGGTLSTVLGNQRLNPWKREAANLSRAGIFRLASNPTHPLSLVGSAHLVATTSKGLFFRSGNFVEDSDWDEIRFTPNAFKTYPNAYCSDVVWNSKGLWVTLVGAGGGLDGVYRSPDGSPANFAQIALPGYEPGARISLGPVKTDTDRMYVLGKVPSPTASGTNVGHAHLWRIDLATNVLAARNVQNFPVGLFVSTVTKTGTNLLLGRSDQSHYDQAIDVHIVGGSTEKKTDYNAAFFLWKSHRCSEIFRQGLQL